MKAKELAIELKPEFDDFRKGYSDDYPYVDIVDEFSIDYFGDVNHAYSFLNSLDVTDFMQLQSDMIKFYEDPEAVVAWLDDPQGIANEIIGFVVEKYLI